jgi:hypothetical protein
MMGNENFAVEHPCCEKVQSLGKFSVIPVTIRLVRGNIAEEPESIVEGLSSSVSKSRFAPVKPPGA